MYVIIYHWIILNIPSCRPGGVNLYKLFITYANTQKDLRENKVLDPECPFIVDVMNLLMLIMFFTPWTKQPIDAMKVH